MNSRRSRRLQDQDSDDQDNMNMDDSGGQPQNFAQISKVSQSHSELLPKVTTKRSIARNNNMGNDASEVHNSSSSLIKKSKN